MNTARTARLGLLVAGALLSAAAPAASPEKNNPHYQGDASKSLALNVALATRLTDAQKGPLTDLQRDQLPPDLRGLPTGALRNNLSSASWLAVSGLNYSRMMVGVPGFSYDALGGVTMAWALLKPSQLPHPAAQRQHIVWLPKLEGESREQAAARMKALLTEAYQKALAEDFGWKLERRQVSAGGKLFGGKMVEKTVLLGGPACGQTLECSLTTQADDPLSTAEAPAFTGASGPAWVWRNWENGEKTSERTRIGAAIAATKPGEFRDLGMADLGISLRDLELAASKHLPASYFIYWQPSAGHAYPAMFRQGEELLFVAPVS